MLEKRDLSIDSLRALAIITMVAANMGPLLSSPHSIFFRYFGSFAAPTFVTLSGMMVAMPFVLGKNKHNFSYYLKRGLFLMAAGAFLDVVAYRELPFVTTEVLYLLGLGLPIIYLVRNASFISVFVMMLVFFIGAPLLQSHYTYSAEAFFIDLNDTRNIQTSVFYMIGRNWLFEGTFPVFPWLGLPFLGVLFAKLRWENNAIDFSNIKWGVGGLFFIGAGIGAMHLDPTILHERAGFAELFYPAGPGFIVLSIGVIAFCLFLIDMTKNVKLWKLICPMGEASLFVYVFHNLIIWGALIPNYESVLPLHFIGLYVWLMALIYVCMLGLRRIRPYLKGAPISVKWVLG